MKPTTPKFWMVWSPQGHGPTYKHATRQAANDEAARLSSNNPGWQFFVLKAVGGFATTIPEPQPIKFGPGDLDDGIPF